MNFTNQALYDTTTQSFMLLDDVSVLGRKNELKQLLKLIHLAKSGHAKTVLISGDAGVGKTALLESFVDVTRRGLYCRVLSLTNRGWSTPEAFYVDFVEALRDECECILDEALESINSIAADVEMYWTRDDLIRAISLVKLQESIGGKEATEHEQLIKAIRSSVPAVKKIKSSLNETIETLVNIVVNPWLMVATNILTPIQPSIDGAMTLAASLKEAMAQEAKLPPESNPMLVREVQAYGFDAPDEEGELPLEEDGGERHGAPEERESQASKSSIELPSLSEKPSSRPDTSGPRRPVDMAKQSLAMAKEVGSSTEQMVRHFCILLDFVNQTIQELESALFIVVDHWDEVAELQEASREVLKETLTQVLRQCCERQNTHLMVALTCRNNAESAALGGVLYNQFRSKMLLSGLTEVHRGKLIRQAVEARSMTMTEDVVRQVSSMAQGKPFWMIRFAGLLVERAQASETDTIDSFFFQSLGIQRLSDILELSFTRLKLTFLEREDLFLKILASLVREVGCQPFRVAQLMPDWVSTYQCEPQDVFDVLRGLFQVGFVEEVPADMVKNISPQRASVSNQPTEPGEPYYYVPGRLILEFLTDKTADIQPDVPLVDKLAYLKKILPLSLRAGELDREKTLEVLSLGATLGDEGLGTFLKDLIVDYLKDPNPVVRVTALNNLTVVHGERAVEAIIDALDDEQALVREYALRNLMLLMNQGVECAIRQAVVDGLIATIDDESDTVRTLVYRLLSRFDSPTADRAAIFFKGMVDANSSVRLIAIEKLVSFAKMRKPPEATRLFQVLKDASGDPVPEIRQYACEALRFFPPPQTVSVYLARLQADDDPQVRSLAAGCLCHQLDETTRKPLFDAIIQEKSEDVRIAMIRALGQKSGTLTELLLLETLDALAEELTAPLVWTYARSFAQIAVLPQTIHRLQQLKQQETNAISSSSIDVAIEQIQARLQELKNVAKYYGQANPGFPGFDNAVMENVLPSTTEGMDADAQWELGEDLIFDESALSQEELPLLKRPQHMELPARAAATSERDVARDTVVDLPAFQREEESASNQEDGEAQEEALLPPSSLEDTDPKHSLIEHMSGASLSTKSLHAEKSGHRNGSGSTQGDESSNSNDSSALPDNPTLPSGVKNLAAKPLRLVQQEKSDGDSSDPGDRERLLERPERSQKPSEELQEAERSNDPRGEGSDGSEAVEPLETETDSSHEQSASDSVEEEGVELPFSQQR